jgi:hypothetical protein
MEFLTWLAWQDYKTPTLQLRDSAGLSPASSIIDIFI